MRRRQTLRLVFVVLLGTALVIIGLPTGSEVEPVRIDEAATEGLARVAHRVPGLDGLAVHRVDLLVVLALLALVAARPGGARSRTRPVRVSVVNGLTTEPGPTSAEGIAALVRDRLARVDLQPPATMPSTDEPGQGIISVVESVESTGTLAAAARAVSLARRTRGYEARLVLRRSDTTTRCGVTAELYDVDRQVALEVTTSWSDTFEDAARDAAFRIAVRLLADLPRARRQRSDAWLRWEPSGASLRAFEDGGRHIARRRYDQAIEHLETGLRLDPENLSIRFRLGHTYERMQRYEEALCTYQRVVDPRYPLTRELARSRQANLIRWRIAIILSNGYLWGDDWLRRLAGNYPETSEIDRRVRGFLRFRYGSPLDDEFRSFHQAFLAKRGDRTRIVPATAPRWPHVTHRIRFGWLLAARHTGLRDDPGVDATGNAVAQVLAPIRAGLDRGTSRGLLARDVVRAVNDALADGTALDADTEEQLRASSTALSAAAYLRRAAIEELRAIGPVRRFRAGLTLADIRALVASINISSHRYAHRDDRADYCRSQTRLIRRWCRWVAFCSRLPFTRSRLRAQTEYHAACAVAMSIDRPEATEIWSTTAEDKVRWVTTHLTRACSGEDNLLVQGVMAWVVHEDPDLERARHHPQFTRFAKAVLNQELDSQRTSATLPEVYVVYAIGLLLGAARAAADRWAAIDPTGSDLSELVDADRALHLAMHRLLHPRVEAAADPTLRAEVRSALERLAPGTSSKLGVWPARPPAPTLGWAAARRAHHELRQLRAADALTPAADPGLLRLHAATAASEWRCAARDYQRAARSL